MTDNATMGKRLMQARKATGMSMETVSERTGITVQTIWRIENGMFKSLYFSTLMALCETYNVSVLDMVNE